MGDIAVQGWAHSPAGRWSLSRVVGYSRGTLHSNEPSRAPIPPPPPQCAFFASARAVTPPRPIYLSRSFRSNFEFKLSGYGPAPVSSIDNLPCVRSPQSNIFDLLGPGFFVYTVDRPPEIVN